MSFGGGGSQTSTSVQQADPRIWSAVEQNMGRAQGIADQPFQSYGGQMTADLTGNQNQAIGMAPGMFDAGSGAVNAGVNGILGAPQNVAGGMSAYQNPYTDQVVNASLNDIENTRQRQIATNKDSAIAARAFGDNSRRGVADGLTNEAALKQSGETSGLLRSQGFNTALGAAQGDASRQQQGYGLLGQLGGQQQQMYGQGLTGLLQTGGLQQGNQQQNLDAMFQEFMRQQNQPYQGQSLINQSLGLLPQGGTTTSTQPKQDNTGGILSGLGSLGGGASLAYLALSDERAKSEIETVGFDMHGRRWATWRYNWDDARVRHFGLIAQETLKTDPDAVITGADGFYRIDYSKLTRH